MDLSRFRRNLAPLARIRDRGALRRQLRDTADDLIVRTLDGAQRALDRLRRAHAEVQSRRDSRAHSERASASAIARASDVRASGPELRIEVAPTPPSPDTVREWLRALAHDASCAMPSGDHAACAAATRLGTVARPPVEIVRALEETITAATRPSCVRRAAIAALAQIGSQDARTALRRMAGVTAERVAWDADAIERDLLDRLRTALA